MKWFLIVIAICNLYTVISESRNYKNTYSSVLRDALKAQQWDSNEEKCLNNMLKILDYAENSTLWAVWILDSLKQPTGQLYGQMYHLSNYDECLQPHRGFLVNHEVPRTQYCMVEVTLKEAKTFMKPAHYIWMEHNATTDEYLKKGTRHGRLLSKFSWGLCVPESCQASSTAKIARSLSQVSHFGNLWETADIVTSHCDNPDTFSGSFDRGPIIFVCTILILLLTTLLCTYCVNKKKSPNCSCASEFMRSFCLKRNMQSLTVVRGEEVHSMNFLRVSSCFFVVYIHYLLFLVVLFPFNGLECEPFFDDFGYILSHSDVVVDTFLALSGILFARGIFSDRWQNPLKFIWRRYIRLVAALSAIVFYMATISGQLGKGPLWHVVVNEQKACVDNWWSNLLMLGNGIHIDKMCLLSTWYISCDYQISVFATILFVIYKKDKMIGKYAFCIGLFCCLTIPGMIAFVNDYPGAFNGIEAAATVFQRTDNSWRDIYIPSYCRAGPFIVGMVLGYIMYKYKPSNYRISLGKLTSCVAVTVSLSLMLSVLFFGHYYYIVDDPIGSAIFTSINRTVWGMAVCIFVGVSEYGSLAILNSIFSWYPLVPLSRLTYGVYLTHMPILLYLIFSSRSTYDWNIFKILMSATGLIVFSLLASLLVWLLVEAPMININNMLLDQTWKTKTTKSGDVKPNGVKKTL